MAEEPGKCRYIMGILEKNKKSKGTAFVYDENNDYYKMEINGIEFVCDSIHSDYESMQLNWHRRMRKGCRISWIILCRI